MSQKTYSQHGEDVMILNLFKLIGIEKPSYCDVGAHDPSKISNTKLLYDLGSRGINIEANPNLIGAFYDARPEDKNFNIGIGTSTGEAEFYMIDRWSGRNTFSKEEAEKFVADYPEFKITQIIKVPVVTLNHIFRSVFVPDFLSIDIEGLDYDVLKHTDFSGVTPVIICVETRRHHTEKMWHMLSEKGYHLYCRMGENLIFVQNSYIHFVY